MIKQGREGGWGRIQVFKAPWPEAVGGGEPQQEGGSVPEEEWQRVPRAALREEWGPRANGLGMFLSLIVTGDEQTGKHPDLRGLTGWAWTTWAVTWGLFPEDQIAILQPWDIALRPQNYGMTPGRNSIFFPSSLMERTRGQK